MLVFFMIHGNGTVVQVCNKDPITHYNNVKEELRKSHYPLPRLFMVKEGMLYLRDLDTWTDVSKTFGDGQ